MNNQKALRESKPPSMLTIHWLLRLLRITAGLTEGIFSGLSQPENPAESQISDCGLQHNRATTAREKILMPLFAPRVFNMRFLTKTFMGHSNKILNGPNFGPVTTQPVLLAMYSASPCTT